MMLMAGHHDPFLAELIQAPGAVYNRLSNRARSAEGRPGGFAFPEILPTLETILEDLTGRIGTRVAEDDELEALRTEAISLRTRNAPYVDTLHFIARYIEHVDARVCERQPHLSRELKPKVREEFADLLRLAPDVLVFPTFSALNRRFFIRTRAVALQPLGLTTTAVHADGDLRSPAEFFYHDLDHVRFFVREDLLALGIEVPDAYRSVDGLSPASTFDPVSQRHRTFLHHAVAELRRAAPLLRQGEKKRLALGLRLEKVIDDLALSDTDVADAAELLLFEIVHEKSFPMDAAVLERELSLPAHVEKLRKKFDQKFYGPDGIPQGTIEALETARRLLLRGM